LISKPRMRARGVTIAGWPCRAGGAGAVVVHRDRVARPGRACRRVPGQGQRVVVVGRLQQRAWTAEDGSARSWSRWWLRSWVRASLVHLGGGTCLECRRTPGAVGSSPPSLAWMKAERSSRGPTVRDASSGNRATRSRAPISEPPATASRYRRCVGPFPLGPASRKDHYGCCHTIPGRRAGLGVAAARGVRAGPRRPGPSPLRCAPYRHLSCAG